MILAILAVLIMLSFLVVIHELGHFVAARRSKILVREFGVGFPPRLFGIKRGKTLYSFNALLLGGFVSLKGENGQEKGDDSYATKSAKTKTKVLLAGVTVNFAFAYIVITVLLAIGIANSFPFSLPNSGFLKQVNHQAVHVRIVDVSDGSAADSAGFVIGDTIIAIDGKPITSQNDLRSTTKQLAGQSVVVEYKHENAVMTKNVTLGNSAEKGFLGVVASDEQKVRYPLYAAPIVGLIATIKLIWATLAAFGGFIAGLVTRAEVSQNVTGPIGITSALPRIRQFGIDYVLLLMAQISLSLAVVNSLPIAPLDGGKVVLVWLRRFGVKITDRIEQGMQIVGFGLLLLLIIVVSVSDISRL